MAGKSGTAGTRMSPLGTSSPYRATKIYVRSEAREICWSGKLAWEKRHGGSNSKSVLSVVAEQMDQLVADGKLQWKNFARIQGFENFAFE